MAINKKVTSELRHVNTRLIKYAELPEDSTTPLVLFVQRRGEEGSDEVILPATPEMFAKIKQGAGSSHPMLSNGLIGQSRFEFIMCLGKKEKEITRNGEKKTITVPVIEGVHCYPNSNYIEADFSVELRRPVQENAAVVQIEPETGCIDVVAFPATFRKSMQRFIKELEKIDSIDTLTRFDDGAVKYTVSNIADNEVTFRCVAIRS